MPKDSIDETFAKMAPLVLASGMVLGEQASSVCYAFRTDINNEYDSGWHFWSGEEDEDYVDDLSNFTVCSLNFFLDQDPTIKKILDHPIGTFWEREPGGEWRPVEFDDEE